jgi:hypothetical protein
MECDGHASQILLSSLLDFQTKSIVICAARRIASAYSRTLRGVKATLGDMSNGALFSRMQVYHNSDATIFQRFEQLLEQRSVVGSNLMKRATGVRVIILTSTSVQMDGVVKLRTVQFHSGMLMSITNIRISTLKIMMLTNT